MSRDDNLARDIPSCFHVARFPADVPPKRGTSAGRQRRPWVVMLLVGVATTAFLAGISLGHLDDTGNGRSSGLKMNVAGDVSSPPAISISLVGADGTSLAETSTELVIVPERTILSAGSAAKEESPPGVAATPEQHHGEVEPQVAILSPLELARAEQLVVRGEQNIALGNIAFARPFFLLAAETGLARGALLLAATYDPLELSRLGVHGVQPNPALARKWYERARQLGAVEAEERLVGLLGG
jgi:hypothetical protein